MREAIIRVRGSAFVDLGIEEFAALCGEAGLKGATLLVCTGPGGIAAVEVEQPFDEERLSALDYVAWWERVDRSKTSVVYFLELTIPDLPDTLTPHHELGVSSEGMRITDHGIDISLVGTQEALVRMVDENTEADVPMEVRAISEYRGSRDALDSLTDRQYEVVRTAYDMGYYEVPRAASTAAVAAALELDPSTVTEHLQRAEHNLLSALLGTT